MTLTVFLLDRIAEDEGVANVALRLTPMRDDMHRLYLQHLDGEKVDLTRLAQSPAGSGWLRHVERWQAHRVLAECEAKRRIVEEHGANQYRVDPCDAHDPSGRTIPCDTLRFLALPYADHPDYREEWKP